jgi:hypothetical protein
MTSKLIDICPKCGGEGLRGEATIDMLVYYDGKYFTYDEDGNEPTVTSWYCFECGEYFTLEQVEAQAKKLTQGGSK